MVELLMVMVVVGVVGAFAVMKGISTTDVTLPSQAQKMATDLRHAQTLASTWGSSLCFVTGGNYYFVTSKGSTACPAAVDFVTDSAKAVTDPATGSAFITGLQMSVTFSSGANSSFSFNSLGQPSAAASFTLSSGTSTNVVSVAATTGKVTP